MMTTRRLFIIAVLALLAACGTPEPLSRDIAPIGDFRLGFNIVVTNEVVKGPASRDATDDELIAAVRAATEERLGRYDGDGLYHIGLRIEAYTLGRAGIPILFSPKSVMLVAMNIWDDATQEKLNAEPIRINAFEGEAGPFLGSGLLRTKEEQLANLAYDAALEIEQLLQAETDTWFAPKEDRTRIPFIRDPATGRQLVVEDPGDGAEAADPAAAVN